MEVASDPSWTLTQWKKFIEDLIKEYGESAVLYSDAGHNNVELILETSLPRRRDR